MAVGRKTRHEFMDRANLGELVAIASVATPAFCSILGCCGGTRRTSVTSARARELENPAKGQPWSRAYPTPTAPDSSRAATLPKQPELNRHVSAGSVPRVLPALVMSVTTFANHLTSRLGRSSVRRG